MHLLLRCLCKWLWDFPAIFYPSHHHKPTHHLSDKDAIWLTSTLPFFSSLKKYFSFVMGFIYLQANSNLGEKQSRDKIKEIHLRSSFSLKHLFFSLSALSVYADTQVCLHLSSSCCFWIIEYTVYNNSIGIYLHVFTKCFKVSLSTSLSKSVLDFILSFLVVAID